MRIIIADCIVKYDGRGDTLSTRGKRLIIIKEDGTVLIHRDKDVRAMNYMSGANKTIIKDIIDSETGEHHLLASAKDETIDVLLINILSDITIDDMDSDGDALKRRGTEKQMQEWLTREGVFERTFNHGRFLMREYDTGYGPVDLLGISDTDDNADNSMLMLIEVKRNAKPNDVFQVMRYHDALTRKHHELEEKHVESIDIGRDEPLIVPSSAFRDPMMFLVSSRGSQKTAEQCASHGVHYVNIGSQWVSEEKDNSIASKARTAG